MEFKNGVSILETLTAALYADPLVVFREYVQNAVDGNPGTDFSRTAQSDFEVNINIDLDQKRIVILDNGDGIPKDQFDAKMRLLGGSQKGDDQIGFRGIGRLAGLSFCNKLCFTNIATGQSFTLYGETYREILKSHPSWTLNEDIFEKITTPPSDESAPLNVPDVKPAKEMFGFRVVMEEITDELVRAITGPIGMSKAESIPSREFIIALQKMLPLPYPNDFDKKDIIESEFEKIGKKLVSYTIKLNSEKLYKIVRNVGDDAFMPMPVRLQNPNGESVNVGLLWISFAFRMHSKGSDYGIAVRSKNMLLQGSSVFADEAAESDEAITTYGQYLSATKAITGELLLDTNLLSDNSRRDWFKLDAAALQLRDFICRVMTSIHRYRYAISRYLNGDDRSDELREKVFSSYRDIMACGDDYGDDLIKNFVRGVEKGRAERPFDARYDETDIRGFSRTQKSFYRKIMEIVYEYCNDGSRNRSVADYYALKAFLLKRLNGVENIRGVGNKENSFVGGSTDGVNKDTNNDMNSDVNLSEHIQYCDGISNALSQSDSSNHLEVDDEEGRSLNKELNNNAVEREEKGERTDRGRWIDTEQGDADAQFNLGNIYRQGNGVVMDKQKAAEWYAKAAIRGHVGAQFNLAQMYRMGDGIGVDATKAVEWYTKAAAQGDVKAQFILAWMYDNGDGVSVDKVKAVEWYTKAAEAGEAVAQFSLGNMYRCGEGVAVDMGKAEEWYTKSAKQGNVKAQFNLALMYDNGDGVDVDKAKAEEWYTKSAERGNVKAQFNLALMYDTGDGVSVDKTKAVEWYTRAAEQGNVSAQFNLALMYDRGDGVVVDKVMAVKWYKNAAEHGLAVAQNNLGCMYNNGDGVEIDKAEAVKWYEMAAGQNVPDSQFDLAMILYEGADGVKQDKERAIKWCKKAAAQGHEDAKKQIGWMLGEKTNA